MIKNKLKKGYALYTAIMLTSILFLVSYSTLNIIIKQLELSSLGADSNIAFYNADTGVECAMYWDLKNSNISAFATSTSAVINCNNQTISTGSQTVSTNPTSQSLIGGGGSSNSTSIFQLNLTKGCVIVRVIKNPDNTTQIESRGYNSCSGSKRFERGIKVNY